MSPCLTGRALVSLVKFLTVEPYAKNVGQLEKCFNFVVEYVCMTSRALIIPLGVIPLNL